MTGIVRSIIWGFVEMRFFNSVRALPLGMALCATLFGAAGASAAGGTWTALAHQPSFNACEPFLLTDGSILVCAYYTDRSVWKLTPDSTGSYINGTWTQMAPMHDYRLYFGSSVLADGRVITCGGEYSSGGSETNHCEIYDPVANVWTAISGPGWSEVGDAPSMVLPDGRFFMGSIGTGQTAFYNPVTNSWSAGPNTSNGSSTEEVWTLIGDGTVLNVLAYNHPDTQKYIISSNNWIDSGRTPGDLVDSSSLEMGGGMLLPNGTVFCMGANPVDDIYTPGSNPSDPGTWVKGPNPPSVGGKGLVAADAPMAMLPNGKILLALGPYTPGSFGSPTYMCEYDGSTIYQVANPGNSSGYPYNGRFLLLPTGQVLFTNSTNQIYIYTPDGTYDPSWAPSITSYPTVVQQGSSYVLQGTQLNGISGGNSYGDDSTNFTNYPILRTQNAGGTVTYFRTFNHSTMGVQTGSTVVSTHFTVPSSAPIGATTLYAVANGIPSVGQTLYVVGPNVFLPSSYSILLGNYVSGSLSSMFFADGQSLVVSNAPTINLLQPAIQIVGSATSTVFAPTTLQVTVTSSVSTPGLNQIVQLYNFSTGIYDTIDTRPATISSQTINVGPSSGMSNYVNSTTGEVRAKLNFLKVAATTSASYTANIDQLTFTIK